MIAIGLHFYHKMQTDCWCARQDLNLHARAMEPKSIVSANSTTGANMSGRRNCRYFLLFGTARNQDEAQICYLCLCSILSVMLPSLLIFLVALIIEPSG